MDLSAAIDLPGTTARPRTRDGALAGSRCPTCRAASFPSRAVCHRCGAPAPTAETFARTGRLVTWTRVHVPRPGLPQPYLLGQVQLDDAGPLVFGQLRADEDRLTAGRRVLVVAGGPGETPYWFEAAGGDPDGRLRDFNR
jgi:uncharacterized protein